MNSEIPFHDLGLSPELLETIEKKGFEKASEIQAKAIPLILENKRDLVGIAQTGTGKTAAFGLPMMDLISTDNTHVKTIILAPTRELALQVTKELDFFKGAKKLKTLTVYGGQPISYQIKDLKRGIDIVVGTPGRVLDLINRGVLHLDKIEFFVLDEADEMLKMGFIDDMELILQKTPKNKRTLLFSATMPPRIKSLLPKYMQDPVTVEVKRTEDSRANIEQIYHIVRLHSKFEVIKNIIELADNFHGIIFAQTKAAVDELTNKFHQEKMDVNCIHGDIQQSAREKILQSFRDRKINILVATDVAARGIDVKDLTHVINHSLPREMDSYTHRIGRTGRAGKTGIAISLIDPREEYKIRQIQKFTGSTITFKPLPNQHDVALRRQERMFENLEEILNNKDTSYYAKASKKLIETFGDIHLVSALLYQLNGGLPAKPEKEPARDRGGRGDRRDRNEERRPRRDSDRRSSSRSGDRSRDDRRKSYRNRDDERKPTQRKSSRKNNPSLPWDTSEKASERPKTKRSKERKPKNRGRKRRER